MRLARTGISLLLLLPIAAFSQPRPDSVRIHVGPNHRASGADTLNRNESWIAASLTNPRVLVAVSQIIRPASRGCATMVSQDGGNIWREITIPKQDDCFDPMVIASPDGRLYILHTSLAAPAAGGAGNFGLRREAPVRVFVSSDDGKTWKGPAEMRTPMQPDHPRIGIDQSDGPTRGRVYVAWNEVSATLMRDKYHIYLHYSDDKGASFSEPIELTTESGGKLVTTEPIILSDGTLLVTYYQYFQPLSSRKNERQPVYMIRSTDGAKTLGKPEKVFEVGMSAWADRKSEFGSAFTLPIFAADPSKTSRFRDRIYAVWDDVNDGDSNIWLTWSADKGRTWSPRLRVNDNTRTAATGISDLRVTPVVAVNRDGVVGVAWYDRREDPTRRCWKKYFAASLDGGVTFSKNVAVSSVPSCPVKDAAPRVFVRNAIPDTALPPADTVEKLVLAQQFGAAEAINLALERRRADSTVTAPRLQVSFDRSRGVWPGHYTGLTVDSTGAFHALWSDRRSGYQQLYNARIDVATGAEPAVPALTDTTVNRLIEVIASNAKFDEANGITTVDLQLRNASAQTVYGPLRVRPARAVSGATTLDEALGGTDRAGRRNGTTWDFSSLLGSRGRLAPGEVSEVRTATIRSRPSLGLDVVLEFEVLGRVAKP